MYLLQVILSYLFIFSVQGMSFIPMPDPAHPDNTLIFYNARDQAAVHKWTKKIDDSLSQYRNTSAEAKNMVRCSWGYGAGEDQVCDVPLDDFGPCTNAYERYRRSTPCIFLKPDEIVNWIPEPYNDAADLPLEMPEDLRNHISMVSGQAEADMVWVSCEGENPADVEFIGRVQYHPRRGFPMYYFPFSNKEGYLSPLVAVYFERPMVGVLINIECKAWAKNMVYNHFERRGSVHFELMVD